VRSLNEKGLGCTLRDSSMLLAGHMSGLTILPQSATATWRTRVTAAVSVSTSTTAT
jgi:hypothetical protein